MCPEVHGGVGEDREPLPGAAGTDDGEPTEVGTCAREEPAERREEDGTWGKRHEAMYELEMRRLILKGGDAAVR